MNKLIAYLLILPCLLLFSFCSGKTSSSASETSDSIPQQNEESKKDDTVKKEAVDFSIELNDKEPASNGGQIILTIKGGVPFSDPKMPFKIESINKGEQPGKIYLTEFVKKSDGVYTIQINLGGDADKSEQELVVTDAEGNKRSENYIMYYYP